MEERPGLSLGQQILQRRERLRDEGLLVADQELCPECRYPMWAIPGVREKVKRLAEEANAHPVGRGLPRISAPAMQCRCVEKRAARQAERVAFADLPHGAAPRTFESFGVRPGTEEAYEAAVEFAAGRGPRVLTLAGQVGSGKTHLLEAIARRVLEDPKAGGVRWAFVPRLVGRMRAEQLTGEESKAACESVRWLLLDDLGGQSTTDWAIGEVYALIDGRLDGTYPGDRLALATNQRHSEMAAMGGARMASRVYGEASGDVRVVYMEAHDYREPGS